MFVCFGGSRCGVSSMDNRGLPLQTSNFYCLPGRAGRTPVGNSQFVQDLHADHAAIADDRLGTVSLRGVAGCDIHQDVRVEKATGHSPRAGRVCTRTASGRERRQAASAISRGLVCVRQRIAAHPKGYRIYGEVLSAWPGSNSRRLQSHPRRGRTTDRSIRTTGQFVRP
jgi:hypothetical protein